MLSQSSGARQTRPARGPRPRPPAGSRLGAARLTIAGGARRAPERAESFMSEHGKCPMGNHPWLATFFVLTFLLVFAAHKLGLL